MVRRYHLTYDDQGHRSYLMGVEMEGRCEAPVEEAGEVLPETSCPRLPATSFRYSQPENNRIPGSVVVVPSIALPPSRDSFNLVPVDLNSDSLPDLIETRPDVTGPPGRSDNLYPQVKILLDNGTWHVPNSIRTYWAPFTRFGYTFTGDFTSRGETANMWFLPPRAVPTTTGMGPYVNVAREGATGWDMAPEAPVYWGKPGLIFSGPGRVKLAGDINGDGLLDLMNYTDEEGWGIAQAPIEWASRGGGTRPANWRKRAQIGTWLATRRADGGLLYEPTDSCYGPSPEDMDGDWPNGEQSVHLADMNGDSLADLVVVGLSDIRYWPSDGLGKFTACRGAGCPCTTSTTSALSNSMLPFDRGPNPLPTKLLLADVNGDGYADFISWDRDQLRVAFNNDGWFFRPPIIIQGVWLGIDWATSVDKNVELVTVADMNGNGIADIVTSAGKDIKSLDLHRIRSIISSFAPDAWAPRPGLLIEIDNGLGAQTDIAYESTADMMRTSLITEKPWPEPMPQIMHVVQRLTTKTNVPGAKPIYTFYDYQDPAWDGWGRRLRGFRKVTVFHGDPQTATESTYFIPSCPDHFCGSTDNAFLRLRAASGRLLTVEVRDGQKRYQSTVAYSYDVQELALGMDGRWVRTASPAQVDTRLYDTTDWDPIEAEADQTIRLKARQEGVPIWTGRSPVRARGSVLLRTTLSSDEFGSVVTWTDHGRIRPNGQAVDDPIVTTVRTLPPRPDWRFLPDRVRTDPFPARPGIPGDLPRTLIYDYDGAGRLTSVSAILAGTLHLDRRHEDPTAARAPPPPNASYNTVALLGLYGYDDLDNIVRYEAPAGSCAFFRYDRAYAHLLVLQRTAVDGCTGTRMLDTGQGWDSGLQAVVSMREPTGAATVQSFDAFGRLKAAYLPDPATGAAQAEPSLTVQYLDQPGGPAQRIRMELQRAPGAGQVAWSYTDGFGRQLLSLRQADPAAGDGGAWIAAGLPQRNTSGVLTGTYAPWFYSGDPAAHPLSAPTTALSRINLDSFDRPVEFLRPDGTLAGRRVYRPLALDSQDAVGRWSRVSVDGHGRLVEQRSAVGEAETVVTVDYLVGGEAARIERDVKRDSPLGVLVQPEGIVRWMQYDSLGRMVLNAEPNTATGFRRVPENAAAMKAWRYAYDWAGRLVGTSDARGCGWNKAYDRLGRLVAVDYSPCLRSQAPYSPPNLADGTGTEAFFRYDEPEPGQTTDYGAGTAFLAGQLVSVQDLAAHTRFAYDARARVAGVARRLARPAGLDAVWTGTESPATRYSADWLRSAASYDDADRLLAVTTGADAPELLDALGQSRLTFAYSGRGLIRQIGGSYGTLVSGATYDALGRPRTLQLGDAAATQLVATYTPGGSLATFRAARSAPALWTDGAPDYTPPAAADPPSTQTVLEDLVYHTDSAGLLKGIDDLRSPAEWPAGAKPVSSAFTYDDLGRMIGGVYTYASGPDTALPPADGPRVPTAGSALRPATLGLDFDVHGVIRRMTDDAGAVFERSLGDVTRGGRLTGPDRLVAAANGDVAAAYDDAGNLVSLTVKRAACSDGGGLCSHRFAYDWDESGQLARARRWDFAAINGTVPAYPALPASPPAADLRYRYDAAGVRVLRSAVEGSGLTHSAWPLAMLRLDGARYDPVAAAYTRTAATEEVDVSGLARVVYRPGLPGPSPLHVLLSIGDHLGSTSSVINKETGELVERRSYLAYGGVESVYRPPRWGGAGARERFTGKEEDSEVGLVYFGARYYAPNLAQWLSPDPLTVHGLGLPGLDPYSYVGGRVTQARDANGLQPCIGMEWYGACAGSGGGSNGGFQIGFGKPSEGTPTGGGGRSNPYYPSLGIAPAPRNSGVVATPATIPFWQALGRPDTWAKTVDPSVIEGFNAGVSKHDTIIAAVGVTAAAQTLVLGGMGAYELGAGLISGAGAALRGFGASLYVTAGRAALWFNELSLAEQGIAVGGGGGAAVGLSRVGRAQQIFAAALEDVPQLGRSTISVGDLVNKSGVSIRVISTNRADMLRWLEQNLVLREGEYLVPWVRNAAHAEIVGAEWGMRNGFASGAFGTSIASCQGCVADIVLTFNLGRGAAFTLDNRSFSIIEILLNPVFFYP